ncbi:MAG: serine/threonine protein kinase, partial [Acidimicrobiales bacterium]
MRSASDPAIAGFEIVNVLDDARNTVFRARDLTEVDDVVIKLLDRAKEPVLPKRFDRSRKALARLCRSNIGFVPLLGHGLSNEGQQYMVSPYYPVGSLQDQVEQGPMPWRLAAELMAKVADIVGNAHTDSVVLGDLRPSNIFMEFVGKPVVAGMGMATRRFDDGGPVFTAPEHDEPRTRLTPAADVYSMALIFGALVAGRPKGRSESDQEFLDHLEPLLPTRFHEVIQHGLAVFPTNRYRNARTMERAIQVAIDAAPDEPTTAAQPSEESFNFDEILDELQEEPPADDQPPIPAEVLPPGLEDIIFVDRIEPAPVGPDPDLSLPAGLEDLTLVAPDGSPNGHDQNGHDQSNGNGGVAPTEERAEEDTPLSGLEPYDDEPIDLTDLADPTDPTGDGDLPPPPDQGQRPTGPPDERPTSPPASATTLIRADERSGVDQDQPAMASMDIGEEPDGDEKFDILEAATSTLDLEIDIADDEGSVDSADDVEPESDPDTGRFAATLDVFDAFDGFDGFEGMAIDGSEAPDSGNDPDGANSDGDDLDGDDSEGADPDAADDGDDPDGAGSD